ncbi:MAG: hypothetical protein ACJ8HF_08040, partial [Pseudomonas sp.]
MILLLIPCLTCNRVPVHRSSEGFSLGNPIPVARELAPLGCEATPKGLDSINLTTSTAGPGAAAQASGS